MSVCSRCQAGPGSIRNRGEKLCPPCMDAELADAGIDILVVPWQPGREPFVYNTVRDKDLVFPVNPVGTRWEMGDGRDFPAARHARRAARQAAGG